MNYFFKNLIIFCFSISPVFANDNVIGGFVSHDIQFFSLRSTLLYNQKNANIASKELGFSGLLEGSVEDISWRMRMDSDYQGSPQDAVRTSLRLKELNRIFQLSDDVTLSVGKRVYALDQSFVNQPLGFFQKRTDLADPTDMFGYNEGSPMIILNWIGARANASLLYSKNFGKNNENLIENVEQTIFKLGYEFKSISAIFIMRRANAEANGFGFTFSGGAGEEISYYGSYYTARGTQQPILNKLLPSVHKNEMVSFNSFRSNDGIYYPRAALGVVLTMKNYPKLQIEYSYDRRGLSDNQYKDFQLLLRDISSSFIHKNQLIEASKMLLPLGIRRNYLDINLSRSFDALDLRAGIYIGLADHSYTWYAGATHPISSHLSLILAATGQNGSSQSERNLSPVAANFAAHLQYRF